MTESAWTETIKPLLGSNYEVDRLWKEHQALEAQLAALKARQGDAVESERAKADARLEEAERRHQAEIQRMREQMLTENEVKIQEALSQFENDKAQIKERARE